MKLMDNNFIIGEDGTAYLYRGGHILASSKDLDELEKLAQDSTFGQQNLTPTFMPQSPTTQTNQPCLNCGGAGCPSCTGPTGGQMPNQTPMAPISPVTASEKPNEKEEDKDNDLVESDSQTEKLMKATHITTPNGVRGKIVAVAKGMWGNEEVTVRLENGRIAKYDLVGNDHTLDNENEPRLSAFQNLKSKLDEIPGGTFEALYKRIEDLKEVKRQARVLVASTPYLDAQELHNMVVTADYEINEVQEAIDALEQQNANEFVPDWRSVGQQPSMGHGDASWLDDVLNEAIGESQSNDFDQMMEEAPETLVAEIDDPMLADQGAVANQASEFVTSHTVGLDPQVVSQFRKAFLARVEDVRKRELTTRTAQRKAAKKTASKPPETNNYPDESLFS